MSVRRIILEAVTSDDLGAVVELFDGEADTSLVQHRKKLKTFTFPTNHYDRIADWLWHTDFKVAECARKLVLVVRDPRFDAHFLDRLARDASLAVPFRIGYNSEEKEFVIDTGSPLGWAVSHHGSADPTIDRILNCLEVVLRRIGPASDVQSWFRAEVK